MEIDQFEDRKTTTQIKDVKGSIFIGNLRLFDKTVPVYELSPQEAQNLNKKGYVMRWIHKTEHSKGEPKLRLYELIGKNSGRGN